MTHICSQSAQTLCPNRSHNVDFGTNVSKTKQRLEKHEANRKKKWFQDKVSER